MALTYASHEVRTQSFRNSLSTLLKVTGTAIEQFICHSEQFGGRHLGSKWRIASVELNALNLMPLQVTAEILEACLAVVNAARKSVRWVRGFTPISRRRLFEGAKDYIYTPLGHVQTLWCES